MTGPIDYAAVLADLEAKRGTLDAAIAGIRAIIAGTVVEPVSPSENGAQPAETSPPTMARPSAPKGRPGTVHIDSDTFFKLTTGQAVRKFLSMAKRPQTPKAIADALHAGGQLHAIDDVTAYKNTYTALMRLKKSEVVVQTRNGEWALAEWYGQKSAGSEPDGSGPA